jgi:acyl-CoA hydrolase
MSVFVGSAAGTPGALTDALAEYGATIRGKGEKIRVIHIHTEGNGAYMRLPAVFQTTNFFTGPNARKPIEQGDAEYAPIFLSEIPLLFRRGYIALDVAMITVSPPDEHGFVSLGVSVDVVRSAVQVAKTTIAVINENVSALGARPV